MNLPFSHGNVKATPTNAWDPSRVLRYYVYVITLCGRCTLLLACVALCAVFEVL